MRCTYAPCQSNNTRVVLRTCQLAFDEKGRVLHFKTSDHLICDDCGNILFETVSEHKPLILKYEAPPCLGEKRAHRMVTKKEIVERLFKRR